MDAGDIRAIGEWLAAAGLHAIEISGPAGSVRIVVGPDGRPEAVRPSPGPDDRPAHVVTAGAVGTFLDRHPWRQTPFVDAGAMVEVGHLVGLVRTGIVYLPVTARAAGRARRHLVRHGETVQFGQGVLELAPA